MGDWTSQNWTKRDGRNNQEQEQQQEKKVTYKTAAELAVKNKNPERRFVVTSYTALPTQRPFTSKLDQTGQNGNAV